MPLAASHQALTTPPATLPDEIAAGQNDTSAVDTSGHRAAVADTLPQPPASAETESQLPLPPAALVSPPTAATPALPHLKAQAPAAQGMQPWRTLLQQTVIALLTLVILFTGATYSSTFRMRLFLWQGDYARAAKICERKLRRRPEDAKLYLTLASIYLALDRQDERAIEVYRKALRFDPATSQHGKIAAIIARYCRHEGEMDSEFWKVLGGALNA